MLTDWSLFVCDYSPTAKYRDKCSRKSISNAQFWAAPHVPEKVRNIATRAHVPLLLWHFFTFCVPSCASNECGLRHSLYQIQFSFFFNLELNQFLKRYINFKNKLKKSKTNKSCFEKYSTTSHMPDACANSLSQKQVCFAPDFCFSCFVCFVW